MPTLRTLWTAGLFAAALMGCTNTPATKTATSAPASKSAQPAVALAPQVDIVTPGDDAMETAHNHQGNADGTGDYSAPDGVTGTYRDSADGWFSWDMKVDPTRANELWVKYAGVDQRTFQVLVDGKVLSDKAQPGSDISFYEQKYPLPLDMTKGKSKITIKFQSVNGGYAGGVFGLRIIRAGIPESKN